MVVPLVVAALLVAQAPVPTPTPPPTIERVQSSSICTALRENVVPSVGAVLSNDVTIAEAGVAVGDLAQGVANAWGNDSPYGNPDVAMAQFKLLIAGGRVARNIDDIQRQLDDPKFDNPSDPALSAMKASLQEIVARQERLLNLIFQIAYAEHPADARFYAPEVQDEIHEAVRTEPPGLVHGGVFGAFAAVANEHIAQTHALEDTAASHLANLGSTCGDLTWKAVPASNVETAAISSPTVAEASSTGANTAAKTFYANLTQGTVDRSQLAPVLSDALTATVVQGYAHALTPLGAPAWQLLGTAATPKGPLSVYRLSYGGGLVLYYGFGVGADGKIVTMWIVTQRPAFI